MLLISSLRLLNCENGESKSTLFEARTSDLKDNSIFIKASLEAVSVDLILALVRLMTSLELLLGTFIET